MTYNYLFIIGLDLSQPVYVFVVTTPLMDLDIWSTSLMGTDLFGNWKEVCWTAKPLDESEFSYGDVF